MTATGITIKEKLNSKSYCKDNGERVTRIEVDSVIYNEDLMYQDITLDTAYSNSIKESFDGMFKESLNALEELELEIKKLKVA